MNPKGLKLSVTPVTTPCYFCIRRTLVGLKYDARIRSGKNSTFQMAPWGFEASRTGSSVESPGFRRTLEDLKRRGDQLRARPDQRFRRTLEDLKRRGDQLRARPDQRFRRTLEDLKPPPLGGCAVTDVFRRTLEVLKYRHEARPVHRLRRFQRDP